MNYVDRCWFVSSQFGVLWSIYMNGPPIHASHYNSIMLKRNEFAMKAVIYDSSSIVFTLIYL